MDGDVTIRISLSFGEIFIRETWLGEDIHMLIWGGRPHLGCTVLAVPRESLTGQGTSATSSVLNRTGHKDETVCRMAAERISARRNAVVVCSGGIHFDNITTQQIEELLQKMREILETM